jgi:hypothetical protein
VKGIPVWKKEDNLYLYDTDVQTNPIKIGTLSGGFSTDWLEHCNEKIVSYRKDQAVRTRRTVTAPKKK